MGTLEKNIFVIPYTNLFNLKLSITICNTNIWIWFSLMNYRVYLLYYLILNNVLYISLMLKKHAMFVIHFADEMEIVWEIKVVSRNLKTH